MGTRPHSDFLYARPSFLSGLARLLDIFGTFDQYNRSRDGRIADARALYCDWHVVGWDLLDACELETTELKNRQKNQRPQQEPEQMALFK